MILLRSTLFNIAFYGLTACACIIALPSLFMPRAKAMYVVKAFVFSVYALEKFIVGLDYEVRGAENIPKNGSFIVTAKHQSPYETMKLHILFKDPAVILKRELLRIPLWGKFLAKSDPIAIDRGSKEASVQIIEGAKRMQQQKRPIVIFPQGTRVYTWQTTSDRPYKNGAARMQEATGLPLIPLALNTGVFWPRRSWIKRPGKIIFEFLPAVMPGETIAETTKKIETALESASKRLEQEALAADSRLPRQERPL